MLSIIKRKDALGLLAHSDLEERFTQTRTEIVALIQIALGGMVAEELFFGEAGTGPSGDLQRGDDRGRRWSARSAWAARSSPSKRRPDRAQATSSPRCSPTTPARAAVEQILDGREGATPHGLLHEHATVLEALRDALLEREELVGDEILEVIRRGPMTTPSCSTTSRRPWRVRATTYVSPEHVGQERVDERLVVPGVVAARRAAVPGAHLRLQQERAGVGLRLAELGDPLGRLPVQHARVVEPGGDEDRAGSAWRSTFS